MIFREHFTGERDQKVLYTPVKDQKLSLVVLRSVNLSIFI